MQGAYGVPDLTEIISMDNIRPFALQHIKQRCNITRSTNPFFGYVCLWLLLTLIGLLSMSKFDSFVAINHFRSYPADLIFTFFTDLGNGIILIPLTIYFLWTKKYMAVLNLLIAILLNTIIIALLKHGFNHPRPLALYGKQIVMSPHWVKVNKSLSFPSGHTASAFCMATSLALCFSKHKWLIFTCFILAALTGYSRIYLGQHFLEDVWLGTLIGVFVGTLSYALIQYTVLGIQQAKLAKNNQL